MAKQNSIISLCVAEYISPGSSEVKWRRVADYFAPPGRSAAFYEFREKVEYVDYTSPQVTACDVKVLDWSPSRRHPNGQLDVSVLNQVPACEVIDALEFRDIFIEDEGAVRHILRTGFAVSDIVKAAFSRGNTSLAVVIPSRMQGRRALLVTDRTRILFSTDMAPKGFCMASIVDKPLDYNRFTESFPVVDIDSVDTIRYSYAYSAAGFPRTFLSCRPTELCKFVPYSASDFAPIYLQRQLAVAAKNMRLSGGRGLTKADIVAILDVAKTSLDDCGSVSEILKISDTDVVVNIAAELKMLLPEISAKMTQDDSMAEGLRALLWADDEIKRVCIEAARSEWMQSADEERKSVERELGVLRVEVSRRDAIELECAELETRLHVLGQEAEIKAAANAKMSVALKDVLASYKQDSSKLFTSMGGFSGSLPLTECGRDVSVDVVSNAFVSNFEQYMPSEKADALSSFLELAICKGMSFACDGQYANWFADIVSISLSGRTADIVSRADTDCKIAEVISMIEVQRGPVVLVEGVFGCVEDAAVLAISRHCKGKFVVFSADDDYYSNRMSAVVFSRVAQVELDAWRPKSSLRYFRMDEPFEPMPWVPSANGLLEFPANIKENCFIKAHNERLKAKWGGVK